MSASTTLVSLLAAGVSGAIAIVISRLNLGGELKKIREQIQAQEEAKVVAKIVELSGEYLTPLRYYATRLRDRLGDIERKFESQEKTGLSAHHPLEMVEGMVRVGKNSRVPCFCAGRRCVTRKEQARAWFEQIRVQVKRKQQSEEDQKNLMPDEEYESWCYYEGIFAVSTLYYTCSYFYCARELRFVRPFVEDRPRYIRKLDDLLTSVTEKFAWGEEEGIYPESQELIGERFRRHDTMMTYAEMCSEHTADERYRRAVFDRPLDVFSRDLDLQSLRGIKAALDKLVDFLDNPRNDPVKSDYDEALAEPREKNGAKPA